MSLHEARAENALAGGPRRLQVPCEDRSHEADESKVEEFRASKLKGLCIGVPIAAFAALILASFFDLSPLLTSFRARMENSK